MDSSTNDLIQYRLEKAMEELKLAKELLKNNHFAKSLNCSYNSMFHATRALLAIKKIDSKKHSSVIGLFNKNFIHPKKIPKGYYTYLSSAFNIRLHSDYDDFFISSKEDTIKQLTNAEKFIEMVENYLSKEPEE